MDIFKLVGSIVIKNDEANKALDETSKKAKQVADAVDDSADSGEKSSGKWGAALSKIGSGAVAVGKTVAAGIAVAGSAVSALVAGSVKNYADYEQLVGGVDTLFKDSSAKVQEYAENAYKTAGLSANEYMNTVTSFAASLIQGLGGDTAKATEYAHTAITDMSDNANKMGTDMASIQTAYQGFAKQNYSMLDNLKLGYGGTQQEMFRLLQDAQKLDSSFDAVFSMDDKGHLEAEFSDIVQAIHIVQENMGITGTTAKEASSTISGSIATMKSSWQNLLTAISSDDLPFDEYVNNFVDSVATVADNLIPRVEIALGGVVQLIDKLAPVIIQRIPELLSSLLPTVINAATGLINEIVAILPGLVDMLTTSALPQFLTGIVTIFNALVTALPQLMQSICAALPSLIPLLISGLVAMIVALCANFAQIIQPIIDYLPDIIVSIVDALLSNLPALLGGVWQLIVGVAKALPSLCSSLWEAQKGILATAASYIGEWLSPVWNAITQWFSDLWNSISQWFTTTWGKISGFFSTLWQGVVDVFNVIKDAVWIGIQLIGSILNAAFQIITLPYRFIWENCKEYVFAAWEWIKEKVSTAIHAIQNVISKVWTAIKNFLSPILNAIKDVFMTVWNAIKNAVSKAVNAIKDVVTSVFNAVKDKVTSVFNAIKNTASTIWSGIKDKISGIVTNIKDKISNVFNSVKDTVGNIFNSIKTKMEQPIQKARDTIKGIVDKIKGFFSGMNISFPHIKMPHFSISPKGWKIGDLLQGSIPKLGIEWYAKAMNNPMLMESPTIFGYNHATGKLMGGGEKPGGEVVSGAQKLMDMIGAAVAAQNEELAYYLQKLIEMLAAYFPQALEAMANPRTAVFDPNAAAAALAVPMNRQLGKLSSGKDRGR